MKLRILALPLALAALAACSTDPTTSPSLAPKTAPRADIVPGGGIITQSNFGGGYSCDATEWHWVINGLTDPTVAPTSITAHFASGDIQVDRNKTSGGVAHYTLKTNLDGQLVEPGATAVLPAGTVYNRFNLSHGPCGDDEQNTRYDLKVIKFFDANVNGQQDGGESEINGWPISILGNGDYVTPVAIQVLAGSYDVSEGIAKAPWAASTPTTVNVTVPPSSQTVKFGNYCTVASGGLTIGYWSNPNGQARITEANLTTLRALNLRNANGTNFDPTTKAQYRTWLLSASATNMAYMLSAQLSALQLNVDNGQVKGNAFVLGFNGTVNELIAAANTALLTGNTVAAGPARTAQETLKNYIDAINNGGPVVPTSAAACPTPIFGAM